MTPGTTGASQNCSTRSGLSEAENWFSKPEGITRPARKLVCHNSAIRSVCTEPAPPPILPPVLSKPWSRPASPLLPGRMPLAVYIKFSSKLLSKVPLLILTKSSRRAGTKLSSTMAKTNRLVTARVSFGSNRSGRVPGMGNIARRLLVSVSGNTRPVTGLYTKPKTELVLSAGMYSWASHRDLYPVLVVPIPTTLPTCSA